MHLDRDVWARVSPLLDEALDLEPASLEPWLNLLSTREPAIAATVRVLLERQAAIESAEFLDQFPSLEGLDVPEESPAGIAGLTAGARVGPYVLEEPIGRGGMGTVWRASGGAGVHRPVVALKLLHAGAYGPDLIERFARERDILASLEHPNIARLYDAGVADNGQPYLALEFVAGEPLDRYCDARHLGVRQRLQLFRRILEAVAFAHGRLVVHRDLKPTNVLVTASGEVRLLDFGVAKLLRESGIGEAGETAMSVRVMTPRYAAPEQVAGTTITTATDVYALGVILYESLTGRSPYRLKRESPGAFEVAILDAEPAPPSQAIALDAAGLRAATPRRLRTLLRGDLDTIVLKVLKKQPHERYATVDALIQDIDNWLAGEPVLAHRDSTWYRTRKFLRRNSLFAYSTAAVLLALSAGLTAALWQARIARNEARTAQVVQDFLRDIFRANSLDQQDPEKGRSTTAAELLDIGARKIDTALQDAPQAKLRVVETLAQMYEELELTERAAVLYRKRVALAREVFGANAPAVAAALLRLAVVLRASPAADERSRALQEAQRILDLNRDFTSRARARLLLELADTAADQDVGRALALTDQAVAINRTHSPDRDAVSALIQQGIFHTMRGELVPAEHSYREGLEALDAIRPPTNHDRSQLYTYLAQTQRELQQFAAAEASHREALRVAQLVGGPDHQLTLIAKLDLGWFLFTTGRRAEGLETIRTATERIVATRADDPQTIPWALNRYGRALLEFGRTTLAEATLSRSITSLRAHRPGSGFLATALDFEGRALIGLGRTAAAATALDEASAIHAAIHDSPAYLNENIVSRVRLLLAMGAAAAAGRELAHFSTQPAAPGTVSESALQVLLLRGDVALARGAYDEAIAAASQALTGLQQSEARTAWVAFEAKAAALRGKALLAVKRTKEALPSLERSVALDAALLDESQSTEFADNARALASARAMLTDPKTSSVSPVEPAPGRRRSAPAT